jgi:uroporphyrinogen-III synthase
MRMATGREPEKALTLHGYHVLVTRPAGRAGSLAAALAEHGAVAHIAPLLRIETLPPAIDLRTLAQDLDRFDLVIVTSANALPGVMPLLRDFWPQWPAAQQWLAVGAGTATALAAEGIVAMHPPDETSEGLLALPMLHAVADKRVLLIAGEGGRDTLEKSLRERGALVTRIATYRRVACESARTTLDAFAAIAGATRNCVALVTSAEALQNLVALAPWLPASDVLLILASERIAAEARRLGVRHCRVAAGASDQQQLAALQQYAVDQETRTAPRTT